MITQIIATLGIIPKVAMKGNYSGEEEPTSRMRSYNIVWNQKPGAE
ncbi:uncharacterized protein METZ01_LOCUS418939 [marine metagenome]|uniref:Uncharacterized protein n=1 Tax=marine metagenome TaxID=408172 RepID=A0A382X646_9ZZZZ